MPDEPFPFLLLTALFVTGIFVLAGSLVSFFQTWRFLRRSVVAPGIVITMVSSGKGQSAPKIKFTTAKGESITFTHTVSRKPPGYQTGQSVTVRYQPSRPHEARLNTFAGIWFTSIMLFIMGMGFTLPFVFMANAD